VTNVFRRFGVLMKLHSNQDRNFESRIMQVLERLRVSKTGTPLHPQADGMVECYVKGSRSMSFTNTRRRSMILRQAKEGISSNTLTGFSSRRRKPATILGGCSVLRTKTIMSSTFSRAGALSSTNGDPERGQEGAGPTLSQLILEQADGIE